MYQARTTRTRISYHTLPGTISNYTIALTVLEVSTAAVDVSRVSQNKLASHKSSCRALLFRFRARVPSTFTPNSNIQTTRAHAYQVHV